ncbi:MAG TPA: hypothetical protein VHB27_00445 [Rhodopila sp.]|uniref:hypothetical protein n=1 Tax=Rhodopila sp. TaxID=2480087 RepID=UPI002B9764B1|nr:hypothetical protein [Rhodopila sp.]HVY13663.1 hypothetical protein [Rhodopila sp.]
MRRALGLLGDIPRHRPEPERTDLPSRSGGGLGAFGGGLHRRRFVQDGDVPVTVLRRDQGHDPITHRAAPSGATPTTNRLQRAEAALAVETAAREKAERALNEANGAVRDLQTKIGHAELAKNEAIETLRRERDSNGEIRAECETLKSQIRALREELDQALKAFQEAQDALDEERRARKAAEKAYKAADTAREDAERLVRELSETETVVAAPAKRARPKRASGRTNDDLFAAEQPRRAGAAEPEPVKWWLNTPTTGKRR